MAKKSLKADLRDLLRPSKVKRIRAGWSEYLKLVEWVAKEKDIEQLRFFTLRIIAEHVVKDLTERLIKSENEKIT